MLSIQGLKLTGQYSHTNAVWRNVPPYGGYKTFLPHETNTVATRLHAAGYTTGLVGKYMNGYNAKSTRNPSNLANRPGCVRCPCERSGPSPTIGRSPTEGLRPRFLDGREEGCT